jgi:DNA repair photolyase
VKDPFRSGPPATAPRGRAVARGAPDNPASRFERVRTVALDDAPEVQDDDSGEAPPVPTLYLRDPTRTLLAHNESPDLGFDTSLNPYRGCAHGCSYCYARPTHEYLGFSAGLDFETRVLVKEEAPALLRKALSAPGWRPRVVALAGVTDAYQPVERRLRLTRRCLEVFAEFLNPVGIVTKSSLVARDADLLGELARRGAAAVHISLTTLDRALQAKLEPRASAPRARLAAIEALAAAGVPVGVMVAPVIPGLTDHEIPALLEAAASAGARFASHVMLRLPHGVKEIFAGWLERHVPLRREHVLARVREMRGGALDDARFHARMRGTGTYAAQIHALFDLTCRRVGLAGERPALSTAAFRRPQDAQLALFQARG